jgi:caffeoyl-CoA O-methyltransferase
MKIASSGHYENKITIFIQISECLLHQYINKNMKIRILAIYTLSILISLSIFSEPLNAQSLKENPVLDAKVKKFLSDNSRQWYDMNIPSVDGQLVHDIILKNNYKSALEIGTSTGHSGIWIAWALSKTGGKLITIDIDEGRHNKAVENFKQAGLSEYIDARLTDAHTLVKELKGPFDFVFSDADKDWYKNYFIDVDPKLKVGGCFTAHNISDHGQGGYGRGGNSGQDVFLNYIKSLKNYETIVNTAGGGVSISYKKSEK